MPRQYSCLLLPEANGKLLFGITVSVTVIFLILKMYETVKCMFDFDLHSQHVSLQVHVLLLRIQVISPHEMT